MTTETPRPRPVDARNRMEHFMNDCPRAGTDFPDFAASLLDGGDIQLSSLSGRAVVLETGSFT